MCSFVLFLRRKPAASKKQTEEAFDFHRVRNADGSAVLCHMCNKATTSNRPMAQCSVCSLNWHFDCVDPAIMVMVNPRTWRCPAHVDDVPIGIAAQLGPAHKRRKIKGSEPIEHSYARGMKNNGYVEIENDDSSDDDDEAFKYSRSYGHTFRLSEKGIKADFLER